MARGESVLAIHPKIFALYLFAHCSCFIFYIPSNLIPSQVHNVVYIKKKSLFLQYPLNNQLPFIHTF